MDIIEMQKEEKEQVFDKNTLEQLAYFPSVTLIVDGRIIACMGCVLDRKSVGIVWVVPSVYLNSRMKCFSKIIKQYIETLPKTFNLKEIVTDCNDDKKRQRFLQWLGFKYDVMCNNINYYKKVI